jgi:putative PIN family toxin of toxin-antitoxin system
MEKDRVVFDTNVWLSSILKNRLDKFVTLIADYEVSVYTCPELIEEIRRNLCESAYFKKHVANPDEHLGIIKTICINRPINLRFDRAADLKDNFLFDLAFTVKSYYLVTGERSLLNMKHVNNIHIVSPSHFFSLFDMVW